MIRRCIQLAAVLLLSASVAQAQTPATQPAGKTVRVLSIGNSFSANATVYLRAMAEAGGHQWVFGHAMIGGSSFERHMLGVTAFEANPESPAAAPYRIFLREKNESVSLKYLLESQPWEYVTIQQASALSFRPDSFEPQAGKLVTYVRKFAPQAKLVIHETWAYRADESSFKPGGLNQQQMYALLHANYQALAERHGAIGIIPVGTAFQNVREDARWKPVVQSDIDLTLFKHPALPTDDRELNVGYAWNTRVTPAVIKPDRRHATFIGKFLGACVWYEFFFGDVRQNTFRPEAVSIEDAALMRDIAHRTVTDKLIPQAATAFPPTTGPTTASTTAPTTVPMEGENDQ